MPCFDGTSNARRDDKPLIICSTHAELTAMLRGMQGLHFVITKTGGLICSVSTSKSFTIRRLGKLPNGKPRWSGPLFSSSNQVGLGLTAGKLSLPHLN